MRTMWLVLSGVLLSIVCWVLPASSQGSGGEIYNRYCATCHGLDARGGNAGTLFDDQWQFGDGDDQIRRAILSGIEQNGMPGFGGVLSEAKVDQLMVFIREMKGKAAVQVTRSHEVVTVLDYELKVADWVPAAAGLEVPWAIDFIDAYTALVTERPGRLRLVINGVLHPDVVEGTPEVVVLGQGGLLDVAVDPEYAENQWIYLGYSHGAMSGGKMVAMTRIVRGRLKNHAWVDEHVVYAAPPGSYLSTRFHFGTRIVFDRQGRLYFSIGDRGHKNHAQDLDRPNGKVHRIHRDGSIPEDNPFVGQDGALQSIYSYGHRNPQGLAVHPETGEIWALEHGPRGGDELNLIHAGKNYGWPVITYGINYDGTVLSELRRREGMEQPVFYWRPSTAVCGLNFYAGGMFPYWRNHLLLANLKYRDVRLLDVVDQRVMHEEIILKDIGRVREAVSGPDGALYVVTNEPDAVFAGVAPVGDHCRKG